MLYDTSRWLDLLWREHLEVSEPALELVQAGIQKQGAGFAGFPADIHARLYLPSDPAELADAPEWAMRLHRLAPELGEWGRLRAMCARNGFAAGIAAEAMLKELLPLVPDAPEGKPAGEPGQQDQEGGDEKQQGQPEQPTPSDADIRAALRAASRAARDAVQDAEQGLDGVRHVLRLSTPGSLTVTDSGPANLKAVREAFGLLSKNPKLRRIAELAGRIERLAAAKRKSEIKPGVSEVHGIERTGDIARLLPSELLAMCHPKLRTSMLVRLVQHQALGYAVKSRETLGRGPVVVLLDESSSMAEDGKDVWSKAVTLALLDTATRQKRAWHLIAFNGSVVREVEVQPGKANVADIVKALDHRCAGGTDFDAPILRAVDIIRGSRTMAKADVAVITDGEDTLEPATVEAAQALSKAEGVNWMVVAVGLVGGETCGTSLGPIATTMTHVTDIGDLKAVLPVVGLDGR
ncbi:MAG TPA: VWA domain-containing protein [Myxococcota bacterium]|nr:VWA domain-containing protein [Myxococcota bacterium]HRY92216.1 VWA domain-containing protein [Myxococcota bacterium]